MPSITIEQLVDIVNQDLTVSGLLPKILPDLEIERIVREYALDWFYKNYQFALIKCYYYISQACFKTEQFTKYKYFILPNEIENVTRIVKIDDPSLFRLGMQAPHLSINLGVTNQPFLTSFVTTSGDLGVYRSIISGMADELNKMALNTYKFNFNHINKQLNLLTMVDTNIILDCYVRIEQEELFDYHMFKKYVVGLCKVRLSEVLNRVNIPMPGGFNYQADSIKAEGDAMVTEVKETIKGQSTTAWFIMSR